MLRLGTGELVSRVANIAIVILLGRRYGVAVLGAYALAQTMGQYAQPLIDFGTRHVGARLIAVYPQFARVVIGTVQRRRLTMAMAIVPLMLFYSAGAQLPWELKLFLFAFSATGALYVASLEWAAWGREELHVVGLAKAIVPASILVLVLVSDSPGGRVLWWAVVGNAGGFLLQAGFFWLYWIKRLPQANTAGVPCAVSDSLAWRRTRTMGLAWLCNLAFNSIDTLMLGLMTDVKQVGLYNAAYRILNQVLATYYVLTQAIYPRFARQTSRERVEMMHLRILGPIVLCGIVIACLVSLFRRPILLLLFGDGFIAASSLLILLAWSIPLDFMTSYLSNAFIAWGMERKVLLSTGMAAATNVVLNLALIPRFGARGAAINTLLSYVILLAALFSVSRGVELANKRRHRPEQILRSTGENLPQY